MSTFNQKQGKKALYQIQRCAYTKLHSAWSPGVELAKGLKHGVEEQNFWWNKNPEVKE